MTRFRQSIKIALLFFLLFVAVTAAVFLLSWRNDYSLNTVMLYPVNMVSNDNADSGSTDIQDAGIWNRLKLINSTSVIIETEKYTDIQTEEELIPHMEESLCLLYNMNALPEMSFSNLLQVSLTRKTYIDAEYERFATVWVIDAEYQDFFVCVHMDAESYTMFDIRLTSKGSEFIYPSIPPFSNGYLEYMMIQTEGEDVANEIEIDADYSSQEVHLYPVFDGSQVD